MSIIHPRSEGDEMADHPRVQSLRTVSVVDAVAEALREDVFAEPAAARRLTEVGVATRYDVARPTAKAAIERLVTEGILLRGPSKTARVPRLGAEDITDLYRLRTCLEVEAVGRLAPIGDVPARTIEANEQIHALGPVSTPSLVVSDLGFHSSLVAAVGSPRLRRIYGSIAGEIRLSMAQVQAARLLDAATIAQEHSVIVAKIRERDHDGAVAAVRAHLRRTEEALVRLASALESRTLDGTPARSTR